MNLLLTDEMLHYIEEIVSTIGVLVICLGIVRSLYQFYLFLVYRKITINQIRFQSGESILFGLEFMVAADIIGSLISPNYFTIGLLGLIVVIRSVLSFFLSLELKELTLDQRAYMAKHM